MRARLPLFALLCAGAVWFGWGHLSTLPSVARCVASASGLLSRVPVLGHGARAAASVEASPPVEARAPVAADPVNEEPEWEPLRIALQGVIRDACAETRVPAERVAAGICDVGTGRYALYNGDRLHFGASIPKVLILLAAFQREDEGGIELNAAARLALARMIRESNNDDAGDMARMVGLAYVRQVALRPEYRLYDRSEGGLWTGCYYAGSGPGQARDPVGNLSHAANAKQILRYYWLLEHGKLVSAEASQRMKAVFLDEKVPMTPNLFVAALEGRKLQLIRKWGAYETHYSDTALVTGPGRHYVMAVLVDSASGARFVEQFGVLVDDLFAWLGEPIGAFGDAEPIEARFGARTASVTPMKVVDGVALVPARSLGSLGVRAYGAPSGDVIIERQGTGAARIAIVPGKAGATLSRRGQITPVTWRHEPELVSGTLYVACDEVLELLGDGASGGG